MSFLSRRSSRPDQRGGNGGAGRHSGSEYDEYDYAPGDYEQDDDNWSPDEYFSPEGIKGRWAAGARPAERPGSRGHRDDERGYDDYGPGPQPARGGYGRDSYQQDSYQRDSYEPDDAYGDDYGTGEFPSGAYEIQDGPDDERGGRKRRDKGDRKRRLGRRDKGDDIWPDDGVSDEDYWASVAADRPLTAAGLSPDAGPLSAADNRPIGRPAGAPRPAGDMRTGSGRLGPAPGQAGYAAPQVPQGPGSRLVPGGPAGPGSGPMPRPGSGPGSGPMHRAANGANSGPMPRSVNGMGSGPMARPGTGPMPRPGTGPMARPGTAPMAGPGAGANSGPMARPGTGPMARPGTGPMARPGTGPMARPGTGAMARPGTGPNSGPMPRPGTGPRPVRSANGHGVTGYGATGPVPARSATGPTPIRPATGPNARPAAGLAQPGFGQPSQSQPTVAQPSLGASPAQPSFQPNTGRGSARQPELPDWGERTERMDRISAGYPDPRVNGSRHASHASGPSPAPAPVSVWGRGDAAERRLPDVREPARGAPGGGANGSGRRGRHGADEDPLTSKRFSREELSRTDGRSYRVASQRAQITAEQYAAALTEQTQTFSIAGAQTPPDRQSATGGYPVLGGQQPGHMNGNGQARQSSNPYDGSASYPYPGQPYPSRPAAADPAEDRYRPARPAGQDPGYNGYVDSPRYNGNGRH